MKTAHALRLALAAATLAAPAVHAAPPGGMRPGLWETTITSNMGGGKPVSTRACVTAQQLEDPKGNLPKMDAKMKCEQLDYKTSGSTVSWKMRCTGEVPMEGTGQMTASPDSYSGKMDMTMKMQGQTMSMSQTMAGKRVGDCPAAK
jgi:hypothetical protein